MTEEAKSKSPPLKFDFVGSKNIRRQKPEAVGCVERSSYTVSRGLSMYVFGRHDKSLVVAVCKVTAIPTTTNNHHIRLAGEGESRQPWLVVAEMQHNCHERT